MKNFVFMCLGAVITLLGLTFGQQFIIATDSEPSDASSSQPEVLYWVAPMDANFRRDQPGQSPMGMDLVPVYANGNGNNNAGVVEISAAVGNNLGVKTALVSWSQPTLSFISSGRVQYAKEDLVHMHARASGWVEKLYVKDVGEKVSKGQKLYGLYSLELIEAQEDYLRAIRAKNESLIRAAKNRLKSLRVDNRVIAQLMRTKRVSQVTDFYATQDGFIEQLTISEGMYVKPENIILAIAGFDRVVVEAEIDNRQGAWLTQYPGQIEWNLTSDLMPTQLWQGELDYIHPVLNESLRTLSLRLIVKNSDQLLKPNMWMKLSGEITITEKTLLIPTQSLIRTQGKTRIVMALGEGRFKSVAIKTGRFFNQQVEVLEGLQAGDTIVTSAQFLIDSESNIDSDLQRMENTDDN
ncbi:MAG: efflux RND transporter periplasmic adaptor subunit [Oleispira sp.]|nr:efflux RND transporter periplasmic adaptor subunit [Oleispira sp.]